MIIDERDDILFNFRVYLWLKTVKLKSVVAHLSLRPKFLIIYLDVTYDITPKLCGNIILQYMVP